MMASAVVEAMASTSKDTQDQPKDGDKLSTSAGEWLHTVVKLKRVTYTRSAGRQGDTTACVS